MYFAFWSVFWKYNLRSKPMALGKFVNQIFSNRVLNYIICLLLSLFIFCGWNKFIHHYATVSLINTSVLSIPWRKHWGKRMMVMSSFNKISTDQLGKRVMVEKGRCYSSRPHLCLQQASGYIIKDDVNGFSSTSDICFMVYVRITNSECLFPPCEPSDQSIGYICLSWKIFTLYWPGVEAS